MKYPALFVSQAAAARKGLLPPLPSRASEAIRLANGKASRRTCFSLAPARYVATAGSPIQEIAVGSEAKDLLWGMRITPIGHVFSGF